MVAIRILEVGDTPAFVALGRLSLGTDPDAFSARVETEAGCDLKRARARFTAATPQAGPLVVGAFDGDPIGILGIVRTTRAAPNCGAFA